MSYGKCIGNWVVTFRDELSYFEAKLENLKFYPDIPFIGFLQNEMYDGIFCFVESIEPIPSSYVGSADTSTIFEDCTSESNVSVSTGGIYGLESGALVHLNSSTGEVSLSESSHTVPIGYAVEAESSAGYVHVVPPSVPSQQKKEEPVEPIDPIEDRYHILDLRKE